MKIIILRHEKRGDSPDFNSYLTEEGIKNSELLVEKCNRLNIDIVYSSPYLRCLQTIKPWCLLKGKKTKVDFSLSEYFDEEWNGDKKPRKLKEEEIEKYLIDNNYKGLIDQTSIGDNESESEMIRRCEQFLSFLKNKFEKTNKTILIVTHLSILSNLIKLNTNQLIDDYPMGALIDIDTGHFV